MVNNYNKLSISNSKNIFSLKQYLELLKYLLELN